MLSSSQVRISKFRFLCANVFRLSSNRDTTTKRLESLLSVRHQLKERTLSLVTIRPQCIITRRLDGNSSLLTVLTFTGYRRTTLVRLFMTRFQRIPRLLQFLQSKCGRTSIVWLLLILTMQLVCRHRTSTFSIPDRPNAGRETVTRFSKRESWRQATLLVQVRCTIRVAWRTPQ